MKEKKFKPLSQQQIIISIDRLTRFKFSEKKYLRVFKDIVLSNLIEPKFKRSELDTMDYGELRGWAEFVFNASLPESDGDYTVNCELFDYENKIFDLDENIKELLKNKLNYKAALKLAPENLNLFGLKNRVKAVVIAEGITEEILLPQFAKLCGFDFKKEGIYVISAGGKNQVVKLFYQLAEVLKLPIFVLLDSDARENLLEINPRLRPFDKVHLIKCGEFEDLLPLGLIQKTFNFHAKNFSSVTLEELNKNMPMVKILEEIYKEKGLHEFKKAEFATLVAKNITDKDDISHEIEIVVDELRLLGNERLNVCLHRACN